MPALVVSPAHKHTGLIILRLESCRCSQQHPDYKNILIKGQIINFIVPIKKYNCNKC